MKQNKIAYAMIRSAVEKGVKDIQNNPGRGIRNLVDLGGMFAGGRFQKAFFHTAIDELQNENSMYYRLVERVVQGTDPAVLTGFGMNLGYNSWTQGAQTIREIEEREGFNIPWGLLLEMESGRYLEPDVTRELIRQGKELGIYTYLFSIEGAYPYWEKLMDLLGAEKDCAFLLFTPPGVITKPFVEKLLAAQTIWVNIDLDGESPAQVEGAAALLVQARCLCGGFSRQADWGGDADSLLSRAEALGLPFLLLSGAKKRRPDGPNGEDRLAALRENLPLPVFPIELYRDMAQIDQNISTEACLTAVLGDGSVRTMGGDAMEARTGYNIGEEPLREILRKALPKKSSPTPA